MSVHLSGCPSINLCFERDQAAGLGDAAAHEGGSTTGERLEAHGGAEPAQRPDATSGKRTAPEPEEEVSGSEGQCEGTPGGHRTRKRLSTKSKKEK